MRLAFLCPLPPPPPGSPTTARTCWPSSPGGTRSTPSTRSRRSTRPAVGVTARHGGRLPPPPPRAPLRPRRLPDGQRARPRVPVRPAAARARPARPPRPRAPPLAGAHVPRLAGGARLRARPLERRACGRRPAPRSRPTRDELAYAIPGAGRPARGGAPRDHGRRSCPTPTRSSGSPSRPRASSPCTTTSWRRRSGTRCRRREVVRIPMAAQGASTSPKRTCPHCGPGCGIRPDDFVVGSFGLLTREKRVETVARAVARAAAAPSRACACCSSGPCRTAIAWRSTLARLGVAGADRDHGTRAARGAARVHGSRRPRRPPALPHRARDLRRAAARAGPGAARS